MAKKLTTEEFIEKAKKVHKGVYNYDKVVYVNAFVKVVVTCRKHGDFEVGASNHINNSSGCPKCYSERRGRSLKSNSEEFISKSKNVHGDYYLYDRVDYVAYNKRVIITCPKHGDFSQTPEQHLKGSGCFKCAIERNAEKRRLSSFDVLDRVKNLLPSHIEFVEESYNPTLSIEDNKVMFRCKKHGFYEQRLSNYFLGHSCPRCGKTVSKGEREVFEFIYNSLNKVEMSKKLTTEDFIEKAVTVHGDTYDYSNVNYVNAHSKVDIVCKEHGVFSQAPTKHLSGSGCPECGKLKSADKSRKDLDYFLKRAKEQHGDFYNYSLVEYKNADTKVRIICPEHGEFEQIPTEHYKSGCRLCGIAKAGKSKLTTKEEFIEKSNLIHNNKYDYSLSEPYGLDSVVKIICPVHGEFEQSVKNHYRGGCRKCANENRAGFKRESVILDKFKEVHGDKYEYSGVYFQKEDDTSNNYYTYVTCPVHGEWQTRVEHHLDNKGCPKCSTRVSKGEQEVFEFINNVLNGKDMKKLTTEDFIERAKEKHGDYYNYDKSVYVNARTKLVVTCPEHGDFETNINLHVGQGCGCPKCGRNKANKNSTSTTDKFVSRAIEKHGDYYDYSKVVYTKSLEKVTIICPVHGDFEQVANEHLRGKGCEKCSYEKRGQAKRKPLDKIISEVEQAVKSGTEIDYTRLSSWGKRSDIVLRLKCPKHGWYEQSLNSLLLGCDCRKCSNNLSKGENEVSELCAEYYEVQSGRRDLIPPQEIDIYIPELKLGIEYNGLRWHSSLFKDSSNYHLTKTELAKEQGIRLVHIFEDEWKFKTDICKSRLLNLMGKTPNKIFARKCEIREVSAKESREFLDVNHIQGNVNSKIKLGLYFENELVSLMTFGSLRKNLGQTSKENHYELLRFCNKLNTNVVGGASKLLKYFEKVYKPEYIISYADRRWSEGGLYENLGFEFSHASQPNYFYVKTDVRENRFGFRKSELIKQGFDPDKTEKQIMEERGYGIVFDCGTLVFVKKFNY